LVAEGPEQTVSITWDLLEGKAEGGQLVVQAEEVVEAPFHCCLLFPSVSPVGCTHFPLHPLL